MNGPQAAAMSLPRPRRALWIVLVTMGALGILTAFLRTWVPGEHRVFEALGCKVDHVLSQPWGLLTSGLLTDPDHWWDLLLSALGLYFLGATLEQRWGSWRFLRFLTLAVVVGNLTVLAVSSVVPLAPLTPAEAQGRFHPGFLFGPWAAITAIAIAWSRELGNSTANLFFVLPIKGRLLFWVTLGFCVLDLIYPTPLHEGVVAPFGGVIVGLLFGGTPSLARTGWLHLRLAVLRRRASSVPVEDVLEPKPKRRGRSGSPALRVMPGGLEEALKKRTPPKDKRYLN
jgi:membrane associated rhomboid family serine protease